MNDFTIQERLEEILSNYLDARATRRFSSGHPINSSFAKLQKALRTNPVASKHPTVTVKASVGKGNWATIPWVALLDSRETKTVQEGVYCVFLFRKDMSGVYLTFNQGVTRPIKQSTRKAGRKLVQEKAKELRKHARALLERESALTTTLIYILIILLGLIMNTLQSHTNFIQGVTCHPMKKSLMTSTFF